MKSVIDADALKNEFADVLGRNYTDDYGKGFVAGLCAALDRSTLPQPSNEALTPEELREMGGQPYWHVGLRKESPQPHWNILDPFYAKHIEDYRYGENWLAYRRPPEGEV